MGLGPLHPLPTCGEASAKGLEAEAGADSQGKEGLRAREKDQAPEPE